jgi:hypothetical protein
MTQAEIDKKVALLLEQTLTTEATPDDILRINERLNELGLPLDLLWQCLRDYRNDSEVKSASLEWLYSHYSKLSTELVGYGVNLTANRSPIESIRDEVHRYVGQLKDNFLNLSQRLVSSISLKEALHKLEYAADRYDYEPLSRVAAILHDTLKNNPIEAFDDQKLRGFIEATKQATEGRADQSDPYQCELSLYRARLSWLPSVAYYEAETIDEEEE